MPNFVPTAMMALIEQSPAAVARHDRDSWLALFATRFCIEDPVGSSPVTGPDRTSLGRFYDTFIAPNQIRFDVAADYGGSDSVVRDLNIHITMAPEVTVAVPMHLRYTVVDEQGQLKISHLAAHWELFPMVGQLLGKGTPAWPVMANLSSRMFKQLGLQGMMGFSRAALTPRQRHYRLLEQLTTAINAQDQTAFNRCFTSSSGTISNGTGQPVAISSLKGLRINKRIAAGDWISASITTSSGNAVLIGKCTQGCSTMESCHIYNSCIDAT